MRGQRLMLIEEFLTSSIMHLKDLEDFCKLFQNVVLLNELNFLLECEVEKSGSWQVPWWIRIFFSLLNKFSFKYNIYVTCAEIWDRKDNVVCTRMKYLFVDLNESGSMYM